MSEEKFQCFVTGNGTDVGKTLVSAIFVKAFEALYWKPVQCGSLDMTDSMLVRSLAHHDNSRILRESYRLKAPKSPHAAGKEEGVELDLAFIECANLNENLVVEGAGGVLVPLNHDETMIDIALKFDLPVVFVSGSYLGSINHTMLSIEAIQNRGLDILGIVFNGPLNPETEEYVLEQTGLDMLLRIDQLEDVNEDVVHSYARKLREAIHGTQVLH